MTGTSATTQGSRKQFREKLLLLLLYLRRDENNIIVNSIEHTWDHTCFLYILLLSLVTLINFSAEGPPKTDWQ